MKFLERFVHSALFTSIKGVFQKFPNVMENNSCVSPLPFGFHNMQDFFIPSSVIDTVQFVVHSHYLSVIAAPTLIAHVTSGGGSARCLKRKKNYVMAFHD